MKGRGEAAERMKVPVDCIVTIVTLPIGRNTSAAFVL